MATKIQDVVKASFVVVGLRLLGKRTEFDAFKVAVDTDVQIAATGLIANVSSGNTEPGHTLTLNRDRIELELSRSRSSISRDYPLRGDLHRLAEVVGQAISNSAAEIERQWAFGFNVELIFDQHSGATAFEYLSRRLFAVDPLGGNEWQLIGGAGRLIFDDSGRRWTISVEPRFNEPTESRVFLTANLHISGDSLPDEEGVRTSLEEVWDRTHEFVEHLDNREIGND